MPSLHHKHQASPGLYSLRKQSPTKCWSGVPSKNTRSHHDQFHLFLTDLSISFGSASPPSRSTNFGLDAAILILHSLKDQPLRCCQFLSKMRTLWSVTKQHHYGCLWDWKPPHTCYTIFGRARARTTESVQWLARSVQQWCDRSSCGVHLRCNLALRANKSISEARSRGAAR